MLVWGRRSGSNVLCCLWCLLANRRVVSITYWDYPRGIYYTPTPSPPLFAFSPVSTAGQQNMTPPFQATQASSTAAPMNTMLLAGFQPASMVGLGGRFCPWCGRVACSAFSVYDCDVTFDALGAAAVAEDSEGVVALSCQEGALYGEHSMCGSVVPCNVYSVLWWFIACRSLITCMHMHVRTNHVSSL